jgi:transposase
MSMGRRHTQQESLWVASGDLPRSPGHPFYVRLNRVLDDAGFDRCVERLCERFYAPVMGRPGLTPGRYFRLLLVGYFEGLDSERAIAWRAADSLAIRSFLGLSVDEPGPDHSTISRTRRLIDVETHREVFTWVQARLHDAGLFTGKTVAIDATTLEANAAMRSIVRRDTGETYAQFLTRLAEASGVKTPTREALARFAKRLKGKTKTSNTEWTSPSDADAKVAKMKDGRTHLAHKAEHVVDVTSGAIVAVTVQGADLGDTTSLIETLITAAEQVERVTDGTVNLGEAVADKGYYSKQTMADLAAVGVRSYIAEPAYPSRTWTRLPEAQRPTYANRRRIKGRRGKRLLRRRGEVAERSFAHVYGTGGMRRTHLRGHGNILKRLLIHCGGFNLAVLMRVLTGRGTPRGFQGRRRPICAPLVTLWTLVWTRTTGGAHPGLDRFALPHVGVSMAADTGTC